MKYWIWLPGRQAECEYKKMCLWSFRIFRWGFDAYILRYPPHAYLPWHRDPVKNGEHWRKNITLKGKSYFYMDRGTKMELFWRDDAGWFRPDLIEHSLDVCVEGCTKLSIGFVKYNKPKKNV